MKLTLVNTDTPTIPVVIDTLALLPHIQGRVLPDGAVEVPHQTIRCVGALGQTTIAIAEQTLRRGPSGMTPTLTIQGVGNVCPTDVEPIIITRDPAQLAMLEAMGCALYVDLEDELCAA